MIFGIQILAISFALFMVYFSFINYKKKSLTRNEWLFWLLLWLTFILITLFPATLDFLISTFHIARVMDLLMILSFMILAYVGFSSYIKVKNLEQKIEDFIRKASIKKAIKENE